MSLIDDLLKIISLLFFFATFNDTRFEIPSYFPVWFFVKIRGGCIDWELVVMGGESQWACLWGQLVLADEAV